MIQIDRILRSNRRSIALRIEADGSLTVRAPLRAAERDIRAMVEDYADWIRLTRTKVLEHARLHPPKTYTEGSLFWFLGTQYPLHLVEGAKTLLTFKDAFLVDRRALADPQAVFRAWYRRQAARVIRERLEIYAARLGFQYSKFRISSARTRWGSCSSAGTVSFSWRLVMAPLAVIDYVVVHELVHTVEHNHSAQFWQRVAAVVPDYKLRRKWLDTHGAEMGV